MRRIFVGDIQGCREELERLLEKVNFDPAEDRLEPAGDLVNRGPDSLGTLRVLRSVRAGGVLGNHDLHLLRVAAGQRTLRPRDTLDELLKADDRGKLLKWLGKRPFVRAWDDVLMVHAGLDPTWDDPEETLEGIDPLEPDPASEFATRARYCDPEGGRPPSDWPPPSKPHAAWYQHWFDSRKEARTLVFGHWARQGLVVRKRLRGLDSGCVWGRKLTAWIAEEDRIVQVRAARAYAEWGAG